MGEKKKLVLWKKRIQVGNKKRRKSENRFGVSARRKNPEHRPVSTDGRSISAKRRCRDIRKKEAPKKARTESNIRQKKTGSRTSEIKENENKSKKKKERWCGQKEGHKSSTKEQRQKKKISSLANLPVTHEGQKPQKIKQKEKSL